MAMIGIKSARVGVASGARNETTLSSALVAALVLGGCGGATKIAAQDGTSRVQSSVVVASAEQGTSWLGGSAVRTRVLRGADGETYLGVWVEAPEAVVGQVTRVPLAVSLVIDTSGSMAGAKIDNARMAATSMLETMSDGDIVSIYAFSSDVVEIAPPTVLSTAVRPGLIQRVGMLHAAGGTALYDGIAVGESRVSQAPSTHNVRRVVVISDGRANIGPSDPAALGTLAAQGTEWGAQVSAIGVGLDYDERTLAALAVESAGRLYHLEHSAQMAVILEQELVLLGQTVATNAIIEIVPAEGIELLGVESGGGQVIDGRAQLRLGSLHAGQGREILIRARVPTEGSGSRELATARLSYRSIGDGAGEVTQAARLSYEVTDDASAVDGSVAPRVEAMVANHQAARAQLAAVELLNQGQGAAAARQLDFAADQLTAAAERAPASPMRDRLQQQARRVRGHGNRAREAPSPAAARSDALEVNDAALGDLGF